MKQMPVIHSLSSLCIAFLSGTWLFLNGFVPLADAGLLLITAILLGAGCVVSLASFVIPELSRLPREQGRLKEVEGFWGLLILLVAVFLLVLDWENHIQGKDLFLGQLSSTIAAVSVLNCFGIMCTSLAGHHCLCWNEESFMLRTVTGRVYQYGWDAITAWDSYRGTDRIYVGKRCFVVPSPTRISSGRFQAYAAERRRALDLPPIPRKTHWPFPGR